MSYNVDKPPTEDKIMALGVRPWETKVAIANNTASRAAYRPYSTYVYRIYVWALETSNRWTGPSQNTKHGSRLRKKEQAHKHHLALSLGHRTMLHHRRSVQMHA